MACFRLGAVQIAAALFSRALIIRTRCVCSPLDVAATLNNLACCAEVSRQPEHAFRLYRKCQNLMRAEVTPTHPRVALLLSNITRLWKGGLPLSLHVSDHPPEWNLRPIGVARIGSGRRGKSPRRTKPKKGTQGKAKQK